MLDLAFFSLVCAVSAAGSTAYVPYNVPCPSTPLIRAASSISSLEQDYLTNRAPQTQSALRNFVSQADIQGLDLNTIFGSNRTAPRLAFAASGGGLRAMTFGGAIFQALDSRANLGTVGGLIQGSQYMAGLSGGSWLIGGVSLYDFSTIQNLVQNHWDIDNVFASPNGGIISTVSYYSDIVETVKNKRDAGFETTITDYWGRFISYHLFNSSNGIPGVQWSAIQNVSSFQNHSMPFPIIVADGRAPGQIVVTANATVYEFNPYEFGSWDSNVDNFVNVYYLGSNLTNGQPAQSNVCLTNWDNMGFTVGTSSAIFNGALRSVSGNGVISSAIQAILRDLAQDDEDIAFYPNPFYGIDNVTQAIRQAGNLTLTDGGLDNQNVPLWPLIQPEREVDAILTVDSSADTTYNWPNGSALTTTYARVKDLERSNKQLSFPYIPDTNTFINLGLNRNVTFFGCNATNGTDPNTPPPILIYIPNEPFSYYSNFSTFDGQYSRNDILGTLQNGLNIVSGGNSTAMRRCIACAVIRRGLERANASLPTDCQTCFSQMCWNGTLAPQTPPQQLLAPRLRVPQTIPGNGAGSGSGGATVQPSGQAAAVASVSGSATASSTRSAANRLMPKTECLSNTSLVSLVASFLIGLVTLV
ncbi:Lysophospholipase 1 [Savitreella phatthalungensis]